MCVRVGTMRCHSMAFTIQLTRCGARARCSMLPERCATSTAPSPHPQLATPAGCCCNLGGSATVRVMRHESNRACLRACACTKRAGARSVRAWSYRGVRTRMCACVRSDVELAEIERLIAEANAWVRQQQQALMVFALMRWPHSLCRAPAEIPPALHCPRDGLVCRCFGFFHALRRLSRRSNGPSLMPNEGAHDIMPKRRVRCTHSVICAVERRPCRPFPAKVRVVPNDKEQTIQSLTPTAVTGGLNERTPVPRRGARAHAQAQAQRGTLATQVASALRGGRRCSAAMPRSEGAHRPHPQAADAEDARCILCWRSAHVGRR